MTRFGLKGRLAAAAAMALALQACDDRGARIDAPEPASLADLSAMNELPYAEPARVDYRAPSQGYAWAERAYGLQRAVYDTPPDYGFEYDGVEPLAWETEDDWAMYAEPWDEGYRYYYYEPGVEYPYFVRDGGYGYAYDAGGILIAVFDSGGRYLPRDDLSRFAPVAGRYWMRGHKLRGAAARRIPVDEQVWVQRAPQVIRTADPWMRAAREDQRWREWRVRDKDRELRRFAPEAQRREGEARQWRERADRQEVAGLQAYEGWSRRQQKDQERQQEAERRQQREQARFQQQAGREQARRQAELREHRQRDQAEPQAQGRQWREQAQRQQREQAQAQQQARQQAQREQQRQQAQLQQRQQREQVQAQQQAQRQQQRQQAEQRHQQMRQQAQAQQQMAQQQRRQAEQARVQQTAQREQQRRQIAQRQAQPQARAAEQQGQPAAAREHGRGRGHERKD